MVLVTMAIPALLVDQLSPGFQLIHALLGTGLLISGATAANQLIEKRWDAKMARTASRPLPSGRVTTRQVAIFAALGSLAGIGYLAVLQPVTLTFLATLSWVIYVLIYTLLKRKSVWHIPLGAVAGAMPVLLGAATASAAFAPLSLTLFSVVFFWQFPHTTAVGWLYREQYACGAIKVAAVVDPSGRLAGRLALLGALGLLLASLAPTMLSPASWTYFAVALSLGLAHLVLAARFRGEPNDANARALWQMSLVHLPLLLTFLLLAGGHVLR
ncbi:MAG: protoheme IX farnesyltransferase [Pirellulales bacterium]|nr:protoheme IX farnesyltransferase [Pirellulales bacterium]